MANEKETYRIQVNMEVDKDLIDQHNILCTQNEQTSAQLYRWLIRQEYARRFSQPTLVTIGEAVGAGE